MLIGSVNYNNNLGFMLVFLLGGMTLVSVLHTWNNLLGLRVVSASAAPVFAGQNALFTVAVDAAGQDRRAMAVSLAGYGPGPGPLDRETRSFISITVPASSRGWLAPEPLEIESLFPLGLCRARARLRPGCACLVYPEPEYGPVTLGKGGRTGEDGPSTAPGGADDFQGLVQYHPGHRVRHIAWKSLARGTGLFVKDFTAGAGEPVLIDFDAVPSRDTERRLRLMTGMVLTAASRNLEYGLKIPGTLLPPAGGDAHKRRCLRALALLGMPEDPP
jgi:uncharacterized protein (DUF58 family)